MKISGPYETESSDSVEWSFYIFKVLFLSFYITLIEENAI